MKQTPKEGRNYYEVLGVVRSATAKEIEGAFHDLARKWHPDVCPDVQQAAENFKLVAEAYAVLGDAERRRAYDDAQKQSRRSTTPRRGRRTPVEPAPTQPLNSSQWGWLPDDLAELIQRMFGPVVGSGPVPFTALGRSDLDVEAELPLSPEEAQCGGAVQVSVSLRQPCPGCSGQGQTGGNACPTCGGAGTVHDASRPLTVQVPPGVRSGTVIRLPGAGRVAPESSGAGDLCLRVRIRPCW